MFKTITVGATVAVVMASGSCNPSGQSGGGGNPPPPPGHLYACDTHAEAPRLNTTGYPFGAAVEGIAHSVCDKPPKSHQVVISLYYKVAGQWTVQLPGNTGVGGTCFSGTDSPKNPTPGDCAFAVPCQTGTWKIMVDVTGTGPAPNYAKINWSLPPEEQAVATIVCPIPKQRKG